MAKKQKRKDDGKGDPQQELLRQRDICVVVKQKKSGKHNQNGSGVIDVYRPDKKPLLALKLESAVKTIRPHTKDSGKQPAHAASGAFQESAGLKRLKDTREAYLGHLRLSS